MNVRFQDFSEEAQLVAEETVKIASRYGQSFLDIEHITLALFEVPNEDLANIYNGLNLDIKNIQRTLREIVLKLSLGLVNPTSVLEEKISIDPRVRKIIEQAQLEADRLSDREVKPSHLFWAVIFLYSNTERLSAVGKMMNKLGITPSKVHGLILKHRDT